MNKRLIVLALSLFLPIAVFAEEANDMEAPAMCKKRTEHLTKQLGLNDEQKTKVEAILTTQHEKIKALHEETDASIKAILTPEQQTKFDQLQQQRKQMRQEKIKEHLGKKPAGTAPAASPAH